MQAIRAEGMAEALLLDEGGAEVRAGGAPLPIRGPQAGAVGAGGDQHLRSRQQLVEQLVPGGPLRRRAFGAMVHAQLGHPLEEPVEHDGGTTPSDRQAHGDRAVVRG